MNSNTQQESPNAAKDLANVCTRRGLYAERNLNSISILTCIFFKIYKMNEKHLQIPERKEKYVNLKK